MIDKKFSEYSLRQRETLILQELFLEVGEKESNAILSLDTLEMLKDLKEYCYSRLGEDRFRERFSEFYPDIENIDLDRNSYTYLQLDSSLKKTFGWRYDEWLDGADRDKWSLLSGFKKEETDPSSDDGEKEISAVSEKDRNSLLSFKDKSDQTQKEKLYNLLKLEKKDIAGQEDISKDWDNISEVRRLITEIARFAISDLGTDRDDKDEYISLSSDKINENEIYGNKSFHTSSFRNWVTNKTQSILPTFGFPEEIITRGLNIVLGISKDKSGKKIKKLKEDEFSASIYELGELVHFISGVTRPSLTRLVELGNETSVFMIISSLPTHELRIVDPGIILEGCMRFTNSDKLSEFLPVQGKDTYSQPPLRLMNVFKEKDKEKQKEIVKEVLIKDRPPVTLKQIFRPDEGDKIAYVKDNERFTNHNTNFIKLEKLGVIRNYGIIRIRGMYQESHGGGGKYYIVTCAGKQTYSEASYYHIPATYWRYICRIFYENPKLEFKIINDRVIIRVSQPLPSRGKRVMASTQALGKWVRRSNEFEILETYKRGDGSSSKLEWTIDVRLWENFVKEYLQKFCLYDLEEI